MIGWEYPVLLILCTVDTMITDLMPVVHIEQVNWPTVPVKSKSSPMLLLCSRWLLENFYRQYLSMSTWWLGPIRCISLQRIQVYAHINPQNANHRTGLSTTGRDWYLRKKPLYLKLMSFPGHLQTILPKWMTWHIPSKCPWSTPHCIKFILENVLGCHKYYKIILLSGLIIL